MSGPLQAPGRDKAYRPSSAHVSVLKARCRHRHAFGRRLEKGKMSTQFRLPLGNFIRHDDQKLFDANIIGAERAAPKPASKRLPPPLRDSHIVLLAVDVLVALHASLRKWRDHRRTLRALADLDEHQLRDIGLTREEVWSGHPRYRALTKLDEFRSHDDSGEAKMKWITREYVKVDRVACPWLIKKFVDKDAEFIFVPGDKVMEEASRLDAIPYDVKNVELGHHGKECSFEAIVKKYKLTNDPALVLLGKIVNAADTDNTLYHQPEGPGLEAIAEGFRHLGFKNDHEVNAAEWIVYDALYAYCKEMVKAGKPEGDFK
jgi:hypothetical protein